MQAVDTLMFEINANATLGAFSGLEGIMQRKVVARTSVWLVVYGIVNLVISGLPSREGDMCDNLCAFPPSAEAQFCEFQRFEKR